ncbi:hypothetical protein [Legionella maceachernii]|uniref:Uncharacterized protein n=1 Tax=Legionella maceachernii TaxID=466 RepID=A0A0W0WDM6_9GAMM|nr:hypothetical protein [Legionella maceachernii]KTD30439.1 hypothetical protein Lmac_0623 [Legionella maceachernii]SJZ69033.1 hypothetical protein SAMN02745128_00790 [Legionella maceachernii]SUP02172.1 Uncharacterised protein [Legionella maceachernii]
MFNKKQLKRRQPASQQPEEERGVKRACLQTSGPHRALTDSYNQILAELEGLSAPQNIDGLPEVWETQLTQEVAPFNGAVNHIYLQTIGQKSAYYDHLAELKEFCTTQTTENLTKTRQTRLTKEVTQSSSLSYFAHTLFPPQNQHANPVGHPAGESRMLQQGDLVSRRLREAYHVLGQALLDDSESDNDASFPY